MDNHIPAQNSPSYVISRWLWSGLLLAVFWGCSDDAAPPTQNDSSNDDGINADNGMHFEATCISDIQCEMGTLCINRQCAVALCRPLSTTCRNNSPVLCSADGQRQDLLEPCPAMTQCRNGECRLLTCEPNSVVCQGATLQICNGDGTGYRTRPCQGGQVCFNGACNDPVCTIGETQCLDDLTLGTCDQGQGGFQSQICGFGKRCEGAECIAFHALELQPDAELTALDLPRPAAGSVGFWWVLDAEEPAQVELFAWLSSNGDGLRVGYHIDSGELWVEGHQGQQTRLRWELKLIAGDVVHLQLSWKDERVFVFLDGLALGAQAVETLWPAGNAQDTLRIGRFSTAGEAWSGRLGAVWFGTTIPEENFVPHCDQGHNAGGSMWLLSEGEGSRTASNSGQAPPLSLSGVHWTGGILGRYARDADLDGFGFDPEATIACRPRTNEEVLALGDCNDGNPNVFPEAPELEDRTDNDCDDDIDEQ